MNDMHIAGVIADLETNQTHPCPRDGMDGLRRFACFWHLFSIPTLIPRVHPGKIDEAL